jgi:hypothetical protein
MMTTVGAEGGSGGSRISIPQKVMVLAVGAVGGGSARWSRRRRCQWDLGPTDCDGVGGERSRRRRRSGLRPAGCGLHVVDLRCADGLRRRRLHQPNHRLWRRWVGEWRQRHGGAGRGRWRGQQRRLHVRRSDARYYLEFVEAILLLVVDLLQGCDHRGRLFYHVAQHVVHLLHGGGHDDENREGRVGSG